MDQSKTALISIIVPVYNVEKYLERGVKSLQCQTLKNIEIILVDDGSTDSSGKICDDIALRDSRIKVCHTANGGVSAARNKGLSVSCGKYIGFMDSDDFVSEKMYEVLYTNICEYNADIAIVGISDSNMTEESVISDPKMLFNHENIVNSIIFEINNGKMVVCNKLFKKDVVSNVRFNEKISIGEDGLFVVETIKRADTIIYDLQPLYHYMHRVDSACLKNFEEKDYSLILACRMKMEIFNSISNELIDCGYRELCFSYRSLLDKILYSNDNINRKYRDKLQKEIRINFFHIINNRLIGKKIKLAYSLLAINTALYKFINDLVHNKKV
jgi:glycosyltransferase involved in cell wall biosynthesis